jgi:tetratricopeptide (TPR) repeat protein
MTASSASEDAEKYAYRALSSLASGVQSLVRGAPEEFRPQDRTEICFAHGLLQGVLGERSGNSEQLSEAAQAYREALREWTRERAPSDWAAAKSNLALVLARLGKRENGSGNLKEAIAAYREILLEGADAHAGRPCGHEEQPVYRSHMVGPARATTVDP